MLNSSKSSAAQVENSIASLADECFQTWMLSTFGGDQWRAMDEILGQAQQVH